MDWYKVSGKEMSRLRVGLTAMKAVDIRMSKQEKSLEMMFLLDGNPSLLSTIKSEV